MSQLHLPSLMSSLLFRCPNLAVKEAEDDEIVEEEDVPVEKPKKISQAKRKKQTQCKLSWIGEPVQVFIFCPCWSLEHWCLYIHTLIPVSYPDQTEGKKQYYRKVRMNDEVLEVGDCVSVSSEDPSTPLYLARYDIFRKTPLFLRKKSHICFYLMT